MHPAFVFSLATTSLAMSFPQAIKLCYVCNFFYRQDVSSLSNISCVKCNAHLCWDCSADVRTSEDTPTLPPFGIYFCGECQNSYCQICATSYFCHTCQKRFCLTCRSTFACVTCYAEQGLALHCNAPPCLPTHVCSECNNPCCSFTSAYTCSPCGSVLCSTCAISNNSLFLGKQSHTVLLCLICNLNGRGETPLHKHN